MSRIVRKPAFCICENKDADQLRGNRKADQRLCFRYMDSTIPLLPKCEILSLLPSYVAAQPSLCRTCPEIPKTGFLRTRLKCAPSITLRSLMIPIVTNEIDFQAVPQTHLAYLSRVMRKPAFWFPTWSDTNQAVQSQKMVRALKFWI